MAFKPFKRISAFNIPIIFILAAAAFSYLRLADNYELQSIDFRFRARPLPQVSDKIVLIDIGEDTLKKLGRFPFDRSFHAVIVKALSEFGAKAVIFDLLFSEPHEHDNELEDAIKNAGNVYLPYALNIVRSDDAGLPEADGYVANMTSGLAKSAKRTGHINTIPDLDGKFRRVPLFIRYEDTLKPYLSFEAAYDYLGIADKDIKAKPGKYVMLGQDIKIPLDDRSNMIVNFSGKWGSSYKHYSFVDLLKSYASYISGQSPLIDPKTFKDKICIIGLTAVGTSDIHPSPFESLYPGVGINAEILNSILNKKFIARASKEMNLLILAALGLLASFLTLRTKPLAGLLWVIMLVFIYTVTAIMVFNILGLWIDMAFPIITVVCIYILCTLYKHIDEWKRRLIMENELGIAKKIQESFLPKTLPHIDGLDISALMLTAHQVGGDLYDFIEFSDRKIGVMVGDVSGKGIPASLFMAMAADSFKSFAETGSQPNDVLSKFNAKLFKESSSNLFVTIFYAILDLGNKNIVYANGGHLPALYLPAVGPARFLDTEDGYPLGLMEGNYSSGSMSISKDDIIIFYTDGVTEAMDSRRKMYGKDRLLSVADKNRGLSSQEILEAIEKDVRKFESKQEQHDDITIVTLKIT